MGATWWNKKLIDRFELVHNIPQKFFEPLLVFGPRPGYSPQICTFISQLTWMRSAVTGPVRGLSVEQLDWLFDKNANSIGALLFHLAATETYYQMNTFDGMKWYSWSADIKKYWGPGMELGGAGRATVKGHDLQNYLDILAEVRAKSLAEFKKRDDAWFLSVDQTCPGVLPTTSASGSTSASMSRTAPARSTSSSSAPPATRKADPGFGSFCLIFSSVAPPHRCHPGTRPASD